MFWIGAPFKGQGGGFVYKGVKGKKFSNKEEEGDTAKPVSPAPATAAFKSHPGPRHFVDR